MDHAVVFVVFMQLVLCNTKMYDLSDGNDNELICPCYNGHTGDCIFEYANKYPGGPTDGLVYNTDIVASCIDVINPITISENSIFNMQVHVPYTRDRENMQVLLTADGSIEKLEWFSISGPIPDDERWMEFSEPLQLEITPGTYKISIWDNSDYNKISIRYFEITDLTTTTNSTTDLTTVSTTEITTELTTKSTTESTTEATTEPTTESTTEPTTEPTTESTTELTTEPTTPSTTEPTTESESTASITSDYTTFTEQTSETTELTSDSTDVPQNPPPKEPKIIIWAVILGVLIGIAAISLLIWFLIAGWKRRRPIPDDMVPLPRLEVVHTSDLSTNSSTIGITRKRTQNWVLT